MAHVLVGTYEGGAQLPRAREGGLGAAGWLGQAGGVGIGTVFGTDVFGIGGERHALATGHNGHAVRLIRMHGNGSPSPADSLPGNSALALGGPSGLAAFSIGGSLHALVTPFAGDRRDSGGIQLIRIGEGGMLEAAGLAENGTGGFTNIHSAEDASFVGTGAAGADAHVLVGGNIGVRLVYVRGGDGALLPAGSARGPDSGFELDNGCATAALGLGGRPCAAVAANHDPEGT